MILNKLPEGGRDMDGTGPHIVRDTAPRPSEGRTRFLLVSRVHVFYQGRLQLEVENVQPVTLVEGTYLVPPPPPPTPPPQQF